MCAKRNNKYNINSTLTLLKRKNGYKIKLLNYKNSMHLKKKTKTKKNGERLRETSGIQYFGDGLYWYV